ncbi:MAG: L-aspartate oxidase [Calditrichaeota bacterium]|nr:MAG: L-aspartate oxidase [Calditrichota bacterium]
MSSFSGKSTHESDFLVIGSGIAGLSFALKAANFGTVAVVTKKEKAESNTNYAQGGIAAVVSKEDSFELHIQDTLRAGAGLCHRKAVEVLVREGPQRVEELVRWGAQFTRKRNDHRETYDLGREGGHSVNRILHAKDLTGREIERALLRAVLENPKISIFENHMAVDLLTEHQLGPDQERKAERIHCWGAYVLDVETGEIQVFLAKAILLATGGCGQVYRNTTNPRIAVGDGIAMAYRAGAMLANLEFIQFHPTALFHPEGDSFLISEAVRGFGGILRTKDGRAFMEKYHPMKDLAPRDIVARAIDAELKKSGEDHVYLDVTHLDAQEVIDHFPNIYQKCLSLKLDITKEPIPVVPAAHYMCGGVVTDLEARTSILGLFACGEVACTGVHGANRLASNSLLEAVVFSHRAVQSCKRYIESLSDFAFPKIPAWSESDTYNHDEWVLIAHDREEVRSLMSDYVGIVRSDLRLQRALRRILLIANEVEDFYKRTRVTEGLLELRNLVAVAQLITRCAMYRKESRGLHYTTDYPETDDRHWKKDTIIQSSRLARKKMAIEGW